MLNIQKLRLLADRVNVRRKSAGVLARLGELENLVRGYQFGKPAAHGMLFLADNHGAFVRRQVLRGERGQDFFAYHASFFLHGKRGLRARAAGLETWRRWIGRFHHQRPFGKALC